MRDNMKVYVAGSRRFAKDFEVAMKAFSENGIIAMNGGKNLDSSKDTSESVRADNERLFQRIDESDIVFVIVKDGYVGYTVAVELGYAYSKKKQIISSEEIGELSVRNLVGKVMSLGEFVEYLKKMI
jgi:hypothetical protein